jgi:hypothetical protein
VLVPQKAPKKPVAPKVVAKPVIKVVQPTAEKTVKPVAPKVEKPAAPVAPKVVKPAVAK